MFKVTPQVYEKVIQKSPLEYLLIFLLCGAEFFFEIIIFFTAGVPNWEGYKKMKKNHTMLIHLNLFIQISQITNHY